jgi:hypothetical protein
MHIHTENYTRLGGCMLEMVDSLVTRIWGRKTKFDLSLSRIDLSLTWICLRFGNLSSSWISHSTQLDFLHNQTRSSQQQYNIQIHMENHTRLGGRMLETVDSLVARIWGRTTKFDLSLSHIDLSLSWICLGFGNLSSSWISHLTWLDFLHNQTRSS